MEPGALIPNAVWLLATAITLFLLSRDIWWHQWTTGLHRHEYGTDVARNSSVKQRICRKCHQKDDQTQKTTEHRPKLQGKGNT